MTLPTTQKALVGNEKATPVTLTTRPVPQPGPNEVLIKVTTAALNPHDQKIRDMGILIPSFPWIPCNDLAGKVVALGPDVTKYAVGDSIFGQSHMLAPNGMDHAGAQEYALLRVEASAKVPAGKSDDDAVTLPVNAIAAYWALYDDTGLHLPLKSLGMKGSGEFDFAKHDLVIVGGGSQVGKLLVQLAKMDGWRKIVVVAGAQNEAELKAMGATDVVDRHQVRGEVIKQVRDVVGDDCLYAVDAVSSDLTIATAALSNEKRGHVVQLTFATVDESSIGEKKAGFEQGFSQGMSTKPSSIENAKKVWDALPALVESGKIQIPKWTVIEGLDAAKVDEMLDKWRDEKAVPEHVHIRP